MYSYSGRGWKPTPGSGSSQSSVVVASADHCCTKSIAEDEDEVDVKSEETDVAAPLPSSETRGQLKMKNTSAKDKRRLREKRRSTGVASLTGHQADEETTRNTSFNETAVVASAAAIAELYHSHTGDQSKVKTNEAITMTTQSLQPIPSHNGSVTQRKSKPADVTSDQTTIPSLSIHDDVSEFKAADVISNVHHTNAATSSNFTKNLCARPFEAKQQQQQRSILKGSSSSSTCRPVAPAKPEAFVGVSSHSIAQCLPSNEESRKLARITELEKLLEFERRENALMRQFLSEKDSRVRDLELNIATLNEDLDLADEDYLRLEEENRALTRALAGMNTADD